MSVKKDVLRAVNRELLKEGDITKNVFIIIEKYKAFLTNEELKFFLRNAGRGNRMPNSTVEWEKIYKGDYTRPYGDLKLNTNEISSNNKLLNQMYDLIDSRDNRKDSFSIEITDSKVATSNKIKYIGIEKKGGQVQFKFNLNKERGAGALRYQEYALRFSKTLLEKVSKVYVIDKEKPGKMIEVSVGNLGYFSYKTPNKSYAGGSVDFYITFKEDKVIDSKFDQVHGYILSDSDYPLPVYGVNISYNNLDMKDVVIYINKEIDKEQINKLPNISDKEKQKFGDDLDNKTTEEELKEIMDEAKVINEDRQAKKDEVDGLNNISDEEKQGFKDRIDKEIDPAITKNIVDEAKELDKTRKEKSKIGIGVSKEITDNDKEAKKLKNNDSHISNNLDQTIKNNEQSKKIPEELPETGDDGDNSGLIASLLLGAGSIALFRRRENKDSK